MISNKYKAVYKYINVSHWCTKWTCCRPYSYKKAKERSTLRKRGTYFLQESAIKSKLLLALFK